MSARSRRSLLIRAAAAVSGAAIAALAIVMVQTLPQPAQAQQPWPSRDIHIVVPWPAGGETDRYARALAQDLGTRLNRPVVVENRAGATGAIGVTHVVRSRPDGHTLLFANTTAVVGNVVSSTVPVGFDPVTDLAPVAITVDSAYVLWAHPGLGITSVDELVSRARDPSLPQLAFGITGPGSLSELSVEQIARHYGLPLTKVPYKGSAPQLADLVAGHTQIGTADPAVALPHFHDGRLVPLLVIGNERLAELPGVPALKELAIDGPDLTIWNGLFAPANLPDDVRKPLTAAVAEAVRSQAYRSVADGPGRQAIFQAGDEAAARVRRDLDDRRRYQQMVDREAVGRGAPGSS